ncbi:kelch-like protein 28 [Arctopsyche grandis]|uniref:kelch-like protein 28 n=1 Tax=Arctopsyche grandis TaxID=121162 RepID=UPI00406D944C
MSGASASASASASAFASASASASRKDMSIGSNMTEISANFGDSTDFEIDVQHAHLFSKYMYRKYVEQEQCDTVLVVGTARFNVHKFIVMCNSDYLAERLEASPEEIVLDDWGDFRLDTVSKAIEYFYRGKLDLDPLGAIQLVEFSRTNIHCYKLEDYCVSFLESALNTENFLLIGNFAKHYSYFLLLEKTRAYTTKNYVDIIQGRAFLDIKADQLEELLQSNDLNVTTEEQVFIGLKLWVQKDWDNRKQHLNALFKFVRFRLLSKEFILNEVKPLCYNRVCCQQLWDLLEWNMSPKKRPRLSLQNVKPRKSTRGILIVGKRSAKLANEIQTIRGDFQKCLSFYDMNKFYNPFETVILRDQYLIMIGGLSKEMYSLDVATKDVTALPQMVHERKNFATAVVGDHVFISGGKNPCSNAATEDIDLQTSVHRYDVNTRNWAYLSHMSECRHLHDTVALDGVIYAIGGKTDKEVFLNSMETFNVARNRWTAAPPMAEKRARFAAVALGGYIYAIGGTCDIISNSNSNSTHDSVERYDPEAQTWTYVASLPEARFGHKAIVHDDKIVCVGGNHLSVLEYSPDRDSWTIIGSISTKRSDFNMLIAPMHLLTGFNV